MKLTHEYVDTELDLRKAAERITDGYLAARGRWGWKDYRTHRLELLSNALYALVDSYDDELQWEIRDNARYLWMRGLTDWLTEKYS